MPEGVRAVAWNHAKANLAAVGLFNGKIIIIDAEKFT